MTDRRFNLLPHRQMARARVWQVFLRQALASAVGALMIVVGGVVLIRMQVSAADAFNQTLASELEKQLPRYQESRRLREQYQKMLQRQSLIEGLDARRSTSVLLLNDLAEAMPQNVYLTRLEEDGSRFRVEGRAVEASAIAKFLETLSASVYLGGLVLGEVKTQDQGASAPYLFSLEGKVRLSNDMAADRHIQEPAR